MVRRPSPHASAGSATVSAFCPWSGPRPRQSCRVPPPISITPATAIEHAHMRVARTARHRSTTSHAYLKATDADGAFARLRPVGRACAPCRAVSCLATSVASARLLPGLWGLFDRDHSGGRARQPGLIQSTHKAVFNFLQLGRRAQERLCLFSSSQSGLTPTTSNYQMKILFDFGPASHRLNTRTNSV